MTLRKDFLRRAHLILHYVFTGEGEIAIKHFPEEGKGKGDGKDGTHDNGGQPTVTDTRELISILKDTLRDMENIRYEDSYILKDFHTMCSHIGLKYAFVKRFFKVATGMSFIQWRDRTMLRSLKVYILENGDMNLDDIASVSGWMSKSKLCDLFRCLVGTSPKKWRNDYLAELCLGKK